MRGKDSSVSTAGVRDRLWGWLAPLLIAVVGGVLRFVDLGTPRKLVFDETYYVKEAASYLRYGVEMGLRASLDKDSNKRNPAADALFNAGNHNIWGPDPEFVVHPPVGKWMIAGGEWLFGSTSTFGWRFSAALVGTLSILMIGRIARRLFGSTLLGAVAALLLAVDGVAVVHSRTSVLDIFVMFWALAAFGCLLIDRDRMRARLARRAGDAPPATGALDGLGPWSGMRWWRIAAVVCLALCTGVKMSGLFFAAMFLVMSVLWDLSARRAAGVRHWALGGIFRDGTQAFVTTVLVLPTVYVATWIGWFRSWQGWGRNWAAVNPAVGVWRYVPDSLRSLWHYNHDMVVSAGGITTPHDWQANPWAWMVLGRPTLFFNESSVRGQNGCDVSSCNQMVTDLGNPLIWWAGTLAVGVLLYRWALARDWRAGAVLAGIVAGYLPWFFWQERTIFQFYEVAFLPWVVLGVVYCIGMLIGTPGTERWARPGPRMAAGGYVIACVLLMWFFYPVLSGQVIPSGNLALRRWFVSWF